MARLQLRPQCRMKFFDSAKAGWRIEVVHAHQAIDVAPLAKQTLVQLFVPHQPDK